MHPIFTIHLTNIYSLLWILWIDIYQSHLIIPDKEHFHQINELSFTRKFRDLKPSLEPIRTIVESPSRNTSFLVPSAIMCYGIFFLDINNMSHFLTRTASLSVVFEIETLLFN